MQEAQFLLMSFEARLEEFASSVEISNVSANMHMKTQRGDTTNFQRGGLYQGRTRGKARGRGGGRSNNSRPICQVCSKIGHTATVCYHKFDQTYTGNLVRQSPSP
ncbi:hypothetical protein EZV62_004567 [Acer yangbiense]|uniref:Uncharacterized protein n=1 Tax=Acer yangbiense TaxID=1000413 RepID=A0A5C7ILY1_9ROSI|nr:hypothetical protein EZV62_004567 [Acer yangbiense]